MPTARCLQYTALQCASNALSKKHYRLFRPISFIEKPAYPRFHRIPSRFVEGGGGGGVRSRSGLEPQHVLQVRRSFNDLTIGHTLNGIAIPLCWIGFSSCSLALQVPD